MSTTSTDQAALSPGRAPGVLTEPEPMTVRSGWDTSVRCPVVPPDLQDCAPAGTPVNDDDPRMLYHASLGMVATPDVEHGLKVARRLLRVNRQSVQARVHVAVDGERGTGKTALTHLIGRAHQGRMEQLCGIDPNRIPVICVNAPPSRDDAVNWSAQIAVFLGWDLYRRDIDGKAVLRTKDWTGPAVHVMRASKTRLVLIDGVDRLRDSDIQPTFDFFDFLAAEIGLTLFWCGTGAREILHEARGERSPALPRPADTRHIPTPRNSVPTLWVSPLPYTEVWGRTLNGFDEKLRLHHHKKQGLLEHAALLYRVSEGRMEHLAPLISLAAQISIEEGGEAITEDVLHEAAAFLDRIPYDT
ncbi:ATP/GTP-binding protein [Kitasatospora xanthocidica]|uniref:ATP/GTP-binding protein n=1 Tax=Kitasatospora xanthocidica TaxID=83382 RepID=A0A372ZMD3_9ACTN|nr:ATP-binding protein [Kitasatospora xanthocidica]RGD56407.1 ATP/GTP-binding protein [Kitasatospora xanthocidica]